MPRKPNSRWSPDDGNVEIKVPARALVAIVALVIGSAFLSKGVDPEFIAALIKFRL